MLAVASRITRLEEALPTFASADTHRAVASSARRLPLPSHMVRALCMTSTMPNSISEFKHMCVLGYGAFSTVYRSKHLESGMDVAIKSIDLSKLSMRHVALEVACMLRASNHPGLPIAYGCIVEKSHVYIVLELIAGQTLAEAMESKDNCILSPVAMQQMLLQLVSTMNHIHKSGVVHRDIKPANIIIDNTSGAARIIDFGLAIELEARSNQFLPAWQLRQDESVLPQVMQFGAPLNLRILRKTETERSDLPFRYELG